MSRRISVKSTATDNDISYEFNTDGFYNILSNQLQQNNSILGEVSVTASNRLHTKRIEYNQLQLTLPRSSSAKRSIECSSSDNNKEHLMQVIKVIETDKSDANNQDDSDEDEIEEKDWTNYQLSNLYMLNTQKNEKIKISPIASFINTDFKMNKQIQSTQKECITQYTGDDIVDNLLMKLSSHMTI
eukprot:371160_1